MHENKPIILSIADGQKTFRHGLKLAWKDKALLQLMWEAGTGQELLAELDSQKPDVLLMNFAVAGDLRALPMLRQVYHPMRLVVLTVHNDAGFMGKIMETGVSACFHRAVHPEDLYKGIMACCRTGYYFDNLVEKLGMPVAEVQRIYRKVIRLTEKEFLLLRLLAEDKETRDISKELRLSHRRVEALRQEMKAKMGARTIAGLIAFGVRNKLIE